MRASARPGRTSAGWSASSGSFRTGTLDLTLIDETTPTPDQIKLLFGRTAIDTATASGDITIR
jgi:hypothetical protein